MSQYTNNSRQKNSKGNPGYRYNSGRSEFMTVLLFYVLPFIVVNVLIFIIVTAMPKGKVTIGETVDYASTTLEIKVKSLLPIKMPVVTLDSNNVTLTKSDSKTYTAVLTSNGILEVDLTSINKMKNVIFEQVNVLDDTPPTIKDNIIKDNVLSFRLEDSQSGVDFSSIYAATEDKPQILPLSVDRGMGLVTFDMTGKSLSVHAKDTIGNEVRVTFDSQGMNIEGNSAEAADTEVPAT